MGTLVCIGLAQYLADKKKLVFLKTLGFYSIEIYLVHMLAGVAVRVILLTFFLVENPVIHMLLGVGGGLLIPIALCKFTDKIHFPYLFEFKKQKAKL